MSRIDEVKTKNWLNLTVDEDVEEAFHPSIWTAIPQILVGLILTAASVYATLRYPDLFQYSQYVGAVVAVFGLGLAIHAEYDRRCTWYVLTDEEVYRKSGIITTTSRQARYDNLQDVSLSQSVVEGLFNFGDVYMTTSGTASTEFTLEDAPNPEQIKGVIIGYIDDATERTYINNTADDTADADDPQAADTDSDSDADT